MPIMDGIDPPLLLEICHKYDIESPRIASNMIITIKRRFQAVLKKCLRETVTSDGQIEGELAEISKFLPENNIMFSSWYRNISTINLEIP